MPFVSRQQERWAFATKQPFAKQWAAMTDQKQLPQRVSKPKSTRERLVARIAERRTNG